MWAPLALNLEYVAAAIEDVVEEVVIVNQEFDDKPIQQYLEEFSPDIFGVTMSATDHNSGLKLCKIAKGLGLQTLLGGYHATAIPDQLLANKNVDIVFRGESEITAREFLINGGPEGIDGLSFKKNGKVIHNPARPCIEDMDSIRFPARHLRVGNECNAWVQKGERHRDQIHTSRGCWGRCTFCCEPNMSNSRQRFRSAKNVMEEVLEVHRLHHGEPLCIIWGDPHFLGRPKLVDEICDLLIEADLDIIFTAMLRADMVATRPHLVKKMVRAGVIGYCMGIETPGEDDLRSTRKSISNKLQKKAVMNLRQNHAIAGGTFVIGLPGQTKEELEMFPEFARNLGMTNTAFAIATPQAGSVFYKELESKGLIVERNWDLYDQMHLVFKHDRLTGRQLEELLTGLLGRFYAPDILIDDMIAQQFRNHGGRMMTLQEAINHFSERADFILNAGPDYQPEESAHFAKIFLQYTVNPYTKIRTEKIGFHNVIDLSTVLPLIGEQKIQITITKDGKSFVHYVFKTDSEKVHYLDVTDKPHDDATINFELAIEDLALVPGQENKLMARLGARILRKSRFRSLLKASVAMFTTYLSLRRSSKDNGVPARPEMIKLPEGYMQDFAAADGWDIEKYRRIKEKNKHK